MYEKFFGLSQDPFSIAPDPRYLYMSERHREALAHLLYGLDAGGGFVLLSGEIGTGKTTVCRCFLAQIPRNCNVAYIFNPKLTVQELLRSVCEEFHVALPPGAATAKELIDPLNAFLLSEHASGRNNVLIIDEAQNLSSDVLEQLRLLTNLETNERKLLQIILIGQPELRSMLERPDLEQLAQRVMARFHLDALSPQETGDYIAHRLTVAGLSGAVPFDQRAIARVHQLSRGVPRRINLLCGRALLGAYASGSTAVHRAGLDQAAAEVFGTSAVSGKRPSETVGRIRSVGRRPLIFATAAGAALGAAAVAMSTAALTGGWTFGEFIAANSRADQTLSVAGAALAPPAGPTSVALPVAAQDTAPPTSQEAISRPTPAEFQARLAASAMSSSAGWQALGARWGVELSGADNCTSLQERAVLCYSQAQMNLPLVRQLNRPGMVTLFDGQQRPHYALLTRLTDQEATLQWDNSPQTVPLAVLVQAWRGSFATLWRAPTDASGLWIGGQPQPSREWLMNQLTRVSLGTATIASPDDLSGSGSTATRNTPAALAAHLTAFQLAQGLPPDGQPGPLTYMQLNRALGVAEPVLNP